MGEICEKVGRDGPDPGVVGKENSEVHVEGVDNRVETFVFPVFPSGELEDAGAVELIARLIILEADIEFVEIRGPEVMSDDRGNACRLDVGKK